MKITQLTVSHILRIVRKLKSPMDPLLYETLLFKKPAGIQDDRSVDK